jgi:hypothetical protein
MNWSVDWLPDADDALTNLWLAAPDRNAVTAAANQIERDLARNPHGVGESREGDTRIYIVPPLAVLSDADDARHEVLVWSVWRSN